MLIHSTCNSSLMLESSSIRLISNFVIMSTKIKPKGESRYIGVTNDQVKFFCPNCNTTVQSSEIRIVCNQCGEIHTPEETWKLIECGLIVCDSCLMYFPEETNKKQISAIIRRMD